MVEAPHRPSSPVSSYSSSSDEEDEDDDVDEASQAEPEGWAESDSQPTFPFNAAGRFRIGSAESPIDFFKSFFQLHIYDDPCQQYKYTWLTHDVRKYISQKSSFKMERYQY